MLLVRSSELTDVFRYVTLDQAAAVWALPELGRGAGSRLTSLLFIPDGRSATATTPALAALSSCTQLKQFELSDSSSLGSDPAPAFTALSPTITTLTLRAGTFGAQQCESLSHMRELRYLDLSGNPNLGDEALLVLLEGKPHLRSLLLARTGITDKVGHPSLQAGLHRSVQGVEFLASKRGLSLHILSLAGCSGVTTESLPHLPKLYSLSEIKLEGTKLRQVRRAFPSVPSSFSHVSVPSRSPIFCG
jgi:hypothetical protein